MTVKCKVGHYAEQRERTLETTGDAKLNEGCQNLCDFIGSSGGFIGSSNDFIGSSSDFI